MARGRCELQTLVRELGIESVPLPVSPQPMIIAFFMLT